MCSIKKTRTEVRVAFPAKRSRPSLTKDGSEEQKLIIS